MKQTITAIALTTLLALPLFASLPLVRENIIPSTQTHAFTAEKTPAKDWLCGIQQISFAK